MPLFYCTNLRCQSHLFRTRTISKLDYDLNITIYSNSFALYRLLGSEFLSLLIPSSEANLRQANEATKNESQLLRKRTISNSEFIAILLGGQSTCARINHQMEMPPPKLTCDRYLTISNLIINYFSL